MPGFSSYFIQWRTFHQVVRSDTPIIIRNVAARKANRSGLVKIAMEKRTHSKPLNSKPEPAVRACCCDTNAMGFLKKWNMQ